MGAISVAFDGTRWADAESASPVAPYGGDWVDDGGSTLITETDFVYQGSTSISETVKKNLEGVVGWLPDAAVDLTSSTIIMKSIITTPGLMGTTDANGVQMEVGSGGRRSAYYQYYFAINTTYPASSSWIILPIDPNLSGYADVVNGSPAASAINWVAWRGYATALAKAPNCGQDALDYITNGTGLTMTDGISATAGLFEDFKTFDEDTINNRYGICSTKSGIFYIIGVLTLGNSGTGVNFNDSNQTIVFPDGRFGTGFCGIDLDLQNGSTTILLTSITLVGKGSYGADGGAADTRPDIGVTGTSGGAIIDSCSIQNFNDIILTSGVTIADTVFLGCKQITQASASLSGCTFDTPSITWGQGSLVSNNPGLISDSTFISSGAGHAIEISTAGEYTLDGCVFTDYDSNPSVGDEAIFNNSSGNVILNITNGLTPSVRNSSGSTTTVNNNVTITIVITDSTQAPIEQASVAVYQLSNDTELFNDFTTIDAAGTFVTGRVYKIIVLGNTDWNAIGASAAPSIGEVFTATGAGSGTGTATSGRVSFSEAAGISIIIRVRKNSPGNARYFPVSQIANTGSGISQTIGLAIDNIAN